MLSKRLSTFFFAVKIVTSKPTLSQLSSTRQFVPLACFGTQRRQHYSGGSRKSQFWKLYSVPICGLLVGIVTTETLKKNKGRFTANAAEPDPRSPFRGSTRRSSTDGSSRRATNNFIADVVDIVGRAVVYIEKLQNIPFTRHSIPIANGSGFIVEGNGLIITNAHVVGNQSNLKVKLPDGREFRGRVVGIDEARDIAAVKIDARNLPTIALGTARDLRPGEWVVAIGSPLALQNTVTAGIVSNMCRPGKELGLRDEERRDMEYIQTDATINVGNSGGPLVNLDGQAIGINTMMASAGIGFAIPIDCVKDFLHQVQQGSHPGHSAPVQSRRRWIGISMLTLTPDIAMQLRARNPNFPEISEGIYVHRVQRDSPAEMSGMQPGDVITHVNGQPVKTTKDVTDCLLRNQVLNITVRRRNGAYVLRVVAEEVVH